MDDLSSLRSALNTLGDTIETIANKPAEKPEWLNNEISGDKIHGGRITKFTSVGITDGATESIVYVSDKGLHVDNVHAKKLAGTVEVENHLNVGGTITASRIEVNEIKADIRNERSTPLEFTADSDSGIYGKGLLWRGEDYSRQFVYRANPDRIWSTESIDLSADKTFSINNAVVLTQTELGSSVRHSKLTRVGTLSDLRTQGNLSIDEEIFFNSDSGRLGIGTEAPNGQLGIASFEGEFIVDFDANHTLLGNFTSSDLSIITDDTKRLTIKANGKIEIGSSGSNDSNVSVYGQLGVGVSNVPTNIGIASADAIQVQGHKIEYASEVPNTGVYKKGDIVYNDNPQPTGYIGWVCIREGTPGEWKTFGAISK